MPTTHTTLDDFRQAIAATGITPPDTIVDNGQIQRFSSNGERGDVAGWYIFLLMELPVELLAIGEVIPNTPGARNHANR